MLYAFVGFLLVPVLMSILFVVICWVTWPPAVKITLAVPEHFEKGDLLTVGTASGKSACSVVTKVLGRGELMVRQPFRDWLRRNW